MGLSDVADRCRPRPVDGFPGASRTSTGHAHLVGVPAGTHLDRGGDPHHAPVGTERTVAFMTQTLVLTGVDRLDDREGELVVVDFKTSRRPNTQEEEARTSLPLALYAAVVWKMFPPPARAGRAAPRADRHGRRPHARSLTRKVAEAESIARDARVAEAQFRELGAESTCFPPRVSSLCTWCDFRAHCPEGQQAGPEKSGWAALEPPRSAPAVPDRLAPRRDGRP